MGKDQEHLRLLSIFHYIVGGMAALGACIPIFHLIFGIVIIVLSARAEAGSEAPPAFVGWLFAGIAGVAMMVGWTMAACIIATGRFLTARKYYMFCLVVAGIECLFMPLGTILGVFTLVVLLRESVKPLFGK